MNFNVEHVWKYTTWQKCVCWMYWLFTVTNELLYAGCHQTVDSGGGIGTTHAGENGFARTWPKVIWCVTDSFSCYVSDYSFITKKGSVALLIINYISTEKCYKVSRRNRAMSGWQQVNMFADEVRGCHQQRYDQRHIAVCLSAGTCASLRGCFCMCVGFIEVYMWMCRSPNMPVGK